VPLTFFSFLQDLDDEINPARRVVYVEEGFQFGLRIPAPVIRSASG
jgi:hypothetical protein